MKENCRTCLNILNIQNCISINLKIMENKSILDLIQEWALIKVANADQLPKVVCNICYTTMKAFAEFILLIRKSDVKLQHKFYKKETSMEKAKSFKRIGIIRDALEANLENTDVLTTNCYSDQQNENINEWENKNLKLFKEPSISTNSKCTIDNFSNEKLDVRLMKSRKKHYQCMKCQKTFKELHQYKMHMKIHTGEKKFLCTICGKYFSRSYVLIYHMRVHTKEKRFKCDICDKSFIHPSNLYKHRKIHTNTRNYKCEFCTKSFIQSEALKIHVRRIHTGEKPFLCEICSKSFSSQSALYIHKKDTHEEKESCKICKKQFSSRVLKRHRERHENKDKSITKYICEQCGRKFSSDYNLRQHLLSHNGMKPYASQPMPCPLCNKMYSKRRIKSHICIAMKT